MISFSVSVDGDEQAVASFNALNAEIKNFQTPLRKSISFMLDAVRRQHSSEGTEFGETWSKLSPKYAKFKQSRFGRKLILDATGKMRSSYQTSYGAEEAKLWNTTVYFKYHQKGTSQMPKRLVLKIDQTRATGIHRIFSEWLDNKISSQFK